jgi:hypothetical protein
MWRKALMTSAVAGALSLAAVIGVDARSAGVNADVNARAGVNTSATGLHARSQAGLNARASARRGPHSTPPGWRHGRKTGWHGGTRPPGLR